MCEMEIDEHKRRTALDDLLSEEQSGRPGRAVVVHVVHRNTRQSQHVRRARSTCAVTCTQ